ncbi:MAG: nuclear transport factor 2 family protein [Burkholderiales bacterium]
MTAITELEERLRRLEDLEAIRALKARYLSCCDRKDPQGVRACFADGPVHIDYGVVGTFETADALVQVFTEIGCHEHMIEMHHGVNPQIEILEAQSARGSWNLHYFLINTKERRLTQLAGVYEDEYRKLGGEWKISRTRFVATSTLSGSYASGGATLLFAGRPAAVA